MTPARKTLLLNPASFEKFDGGASSRWPATREIESYWYLVWLAYPAGMLPGSRLLDAPPHKVSLAETIHIAQEYEFVVVFTSSIGFRNDLCLARGMKEAKPDLKIAFVGPYVQIKPGETLLASGDIDFIVRGEFDHAVVEFAEGKPLEQIKNASYSKGGLLVHNPSRPPLHTEELDALPFATEVYQRDLTIENYNVPFLLHPYVSFYTSRLPGAVHLLLVAANAIRPRLAHALGRKRGARIPPSACGDAASEGILFRRRYIQHSQGSCSRALRAARTRGIPLVLYGARPQRLRDLASDGASRRAAAHRGV